MYTLLRVTCYNACSSVLFGEGKGKRIFESLTHYLMQSRQNLHSATYY